MLVKLVGMISSHAYLIPKYKMAMPFYAFKTIARLCF